MANLIWTKSKEHQLAARRIPKIGAVNIRCKKHPKQRQSPGVCSACLREKLCQLPATSSFRNAKEEFDSTSTGSSLSSYSSSSSCSSSRASPPRRKQGGRNGNGNGNGGGAILSLSEVLKLGSARQKNDQRHVMMVMRKSRSVAVAPTTERDGGEGKKKKKKGFWSILKRRKGAEEETRQRPTRLGHSITMRDLFLITSG